MKAILISEKYNFTQERFEEIAKSDSMGGYEFLATNVILFDLLIASHLLANTQSFLSDLEHSYHVVYLRDEPVVFQHPDRVVSTFGALAG